MEKMFFICKDCLGELENILKIKMKYNYLKSKNLKIVVFLFCFW